MASPVSPSPGPRHSAGLQARAGQCHTVIMSPPGLAAASQLGPAASAHILPRP